NRKGTMDAAEMVKLLSSENELSAEAGQVEIFFV
ncbi:MAG: hypothetical protein RI957_1399, partial [Verrucomicrobiota bacterium]